MTKDIPQRPITIKCEPFEELKEMAMSAEHELASVEEINGSSAYLWHKDGRVQVCKFMFDVHPRTHLPPLLKSEQPDAYIWIGEVYQRRIDEKNPRTHLDLSQDPKAVERLVAIVKQRYHDAELWGAMISPGATPRCGEWEKMADKDVGGGMIIEEW